MLRKEFSIHMLRGASQFLWSVQCNTTINTIIDKLTGFQWSDAGNSTAQNTRRVDGRGSTP